MLHLRPALIRYVSCREPLVRIRLPLSVLLYLLLLLRPTFLGHASRRVRLVT